MPELPDEATAEEEVAYSEGLVELAAGLYKLAGHRMELGERRIKELALKYEKATIHPESFAFFKVGQLVLKRKPAFSKLDARGSGPYQVVKIGGMFG